MGAILCTNLYIYLLIWLKFALGSQFNKWQIKKNKLALRVDFLDLG